MNYEYDIEKVKLKITKDEFGYQEVLDDFKNAREIRIVTFNLTHNEKDDVLFKQLHCLENEVDIQIITNIPSRLSWYTQSQKGNILANKAKNTIGLYLSKVNPQNFKKLTPFFNFNNHAKIIGTENIVYIGSENFSEASSRNYEAGIVTMDKKFIKYLYDSFFEDLKNDSEPYFKHGYNEVRLFIVSILTRIMNTYDEVLDNLFVEYNNKLIFIDDETNLSINFLEELQCSICELEEITSIVDELDITDEYMKKLYDELNDVLEQIDTRNVLELIEEDSEIYNYFAWNEQEEFDIAFEEYSMEAYDEYLDEYVDRASQDVFEKFLDIKLEVESKIFELRDNLEDVIRLLEKAIELLYTYYENSRNESIDNTSL